MAGEGKILQDAREKKGLTLKNVEEEIKIRIMYLEALENEQYEILPGTAYTKGFLRTYSKHLELNSAHIIDLFNSSFQQKTPSESYPPLTPIQSTSVWFKPIVLLVMGLIAVAIVIGITYLSRMNIKPQLSDYKPAPLPTAPQTSTVPSSDQNTVQPSSPAKEQSPAVYQGIVAEMTFKQNCWLKVKVDGAIVEDGMNEAGTTKTLQGTQKIEFLTIGNAGGILVKLNGKEIPSLGSSGEVVRNYIVTEEVIKNL
ncbi:MAG: Cytoskeleton protein RodZ [Candidatus Dichloromethanomonas elyunquensis]|nr:MAG: Cytoskeleton protein RodZ [Candidatus Dichloromethanomonas elyunquensis]